MAPGKFLAMTAGNSEAQNIPGMITSFSPALKNHLNAVLSNARQKRQFEM